MRTAGVGLDILEIDRMERALARTPRIGQRLFTEEELAYCKRMSRPAQHLAGRFAAREAVLKALGTGFGQGVGLKDVSVTRDEAGRPQALIIGRAAELAQAKGVLEVAISLSYTHDMAAATAVAMTADTRPAKEQAEDASAEMTRSFKAARSVLDELDRMLEQRTGAVHDEGLAESPADEDSEGE